MKSAKFYPFGSNQDSVISSSFSSNLPEVLFERIAHMQRFQEYLTDVSLFPQKKRDRWIKKHEWLMKDMFDKIRDESHLTLRDFALDPITKKSVMEYMVTVQQTLAMIEKTLDDEIVASN